jgi:2Fe-2S ferredoxin
MVKVICIDADGEQSELEVQEGWTLMQAAVTQGVEGIEAECGGSCCCATCHVYVDESFLERLDAPSEQEQGMLAETVAERRSNSRLACQIKLTESLDGLTVRLPEVQS